MRGFRIGKKFNKSGWRFYRNGELIFENARVPHANVVGNVGRTVKKTGRRGGDTTGGDIFGDLELCANALGVCDDACETALRYAKMEEQGGRPLSPSSASNFRLIRCTGSPRRCAHSCCGWSGNTTTRSIPVTPDSP